MRNALIYLCGAGLVLMAIVSCGSGAPSTPDDGDGQVGYAASDLPRDRSPNVSDPDSRELVAGNTEFAFDLYHEIKTGEENLFYSPYSISLALAMTYSGARGNTETQIAETLHFTLPQERLHPAFNALDLALESRGEGAMGKDGEGFRLSIANSTWGQRDYWFLPEFLDVIAVNYGAGMRLVDFRSAPEDCRILINSWVEDETEDRIKDLLPQGVIDTDTALVLVNAIYFNAAWLNQFDEELTSDGEFHLLGGDAVIVPMMAQTEVFGYAEGDGWQAVELPYDGEELSMVILLPAAGWFEEFENRLDAARVEGIVGALSRESVRLTMPRFEYDAEFMMKPTLAAMGMVDAFSEGIANFSGMDGTLLLYISEVIHKAFVSVDEAGTEAAAATAVIMVPIGIPDSVECRIDRPFIFMIRDIPTGAILFVGRVMNPGV